MFEHLKGKFQTIDPPPHDTLPEKLEAIKRKFPALPEDYLVFMQEIGHGHMGCFILYSGPSEAALTFKDRDEAWASIILIGDDMQGYRIGFDSEDEFRMIEIDPRGKLRYLPERTFGEYLLRKLRNVGWV